MSLHTFTVTDDNFEREVLVSDAPVLVDFWAPWCGPCRILGPIVEDVAAEFAGRIKVGKLNIDTYPEIATAYNIQAIPTLLIFHQGQVVDRIVGIVSPTVLAARLNSLLRHELQAASAVA